MSKPFLLEIGCEEIPARFVPLLLTQLKNKFITFFNDKRLVFDDVKTYGTYRRLVVYVEGLADTQQDSEEWIKGPPKVIAYNDKGELTKAGQGFAKRYGVKESTLSCREFEDKEYLSFLLKHDSEQTVDMLPTLIPEVIGGLNLPIAMYWGNHQGPFIRPIHWVVCLYGTAFLSFDLFDVSSGNFTFGHRILTQSSSLNGKKFTVRSVKNYFDILAKKGCVILDQDKRQAMILSDLEKHGLDQPDMELVAEVNYLVENPQMITGEFDKRFLVVPHKVLVECMKKHQKYFPVYKSGKLTNKFLVVADNVTDQNKLLIKKGNQRVLSARLADSLFFWNTDSAVSLDSFVSKLKGVVFQKGIGSMFDKQERLQSILLYFKQQQYISYDQHLLERVSYLSKADLVTQMVTEFPSLQGYMGGIYAKNSGDDDLVATAIAEHYFPLYYGGKLPETELGSWLAIGDRLDFVVGSFYNGVKPTGSQDPLGLRRAVYSIFSLLFAQNCAFDLHQSIDYCFSLFGKEPQFKERFMEFFNQRLKSFLMDQGLRYDIAATVLDSGYYNIAQACEKGQLLDDYRLEKGPDFKLLIDTAIRIKRLAAKADSETISEDLFVLPVEKEVFTVFKDLECGLDDMDIDIFEPLLEPMTRYFNDVLVMDKDHKLKANRLAFLNQLDMFFMKIGNFEHIVID